MLARSIEPRASDTTPASGSSTCDGVVRRRLEDAVELPAPRDRLVDAHMHPLADGPAEVFSTDEFAAG